MVRTFGPGLLDPGLFDPGLLDPGLLCPGLLRPGLLHAGLLDAALYVLARPVLLLLFAQCLPLLTLLTLPGILLRALLLLDGFAHTLVRLPVANLPHPIRNRAGIPNRALNRRRKIGHRLIRSGSFNPGL